MEIGTKIYCVNESVYDENLTKGKEYIIYDHKEGQFRVKADQDKLAWFPDYCFSFEEISTIVAINLDDKINDPKNDQVEVTIEFSNGEKHWTTFYTTGYLNTLLETNPYLTFPKAIIVKELKESEIREIINSLDRQNELIKVSEVFLLKE